MQELLDLQRKMYLHLQKEFDNIEDSVLAERFNLHLQEIHDWIGRKNNIQCLYVHHREILNDPLGQAQKIQMFLNIPLDLEAMSKVVDPSLYRNRKP